MEEGHAFGVSIEAAVLPMGSVVFLVGVISVLHIAFGQEAKMAIGLSSRIEEPTYHPVLHGLTFDPLLAWSWQSCSNTTLVLSGELG